MGVTLSRRAVLAGAPLALMGCAAEPIWAPDAAVADAAYRHPGLPMLTLFTTRNVGSGNGAHSGLMVNASQRVLFDPAGTFAHPSLPERNDVIFGMTPRIVDFYTGYHARTSYYVVEQSLIVSPEIAERTLQVVRDYGPVRKANCARAVAKVLNTTGIARFRISWFPDNLEDQFADVPGVQTIEHRETDADDRTGVLTGIAPE